MKQGTKIIWRRGDALNVLRYGRTSNAKISTGTDPIIQSYHFSRAQYEFAASGGQGWKGIFEADTTANCYDCPYAGPNGECYVRQPVQGSGLLSMLRSIVRVYPTWADVPEFSDVDVEPMVQAASGRYVRLGSYGEPVNLPYPLVRDLVTAARSYTGYTHQWRNPLFAAYARYLMASTDDETVGTATGWREFAALSDVEAPYVQCPASAEAGYRSNCAKCGLCSGNDGKGAKSIKIQLHGANV